MLKALVFGGTACSAYLLINSSIFTARKACGIRLIRISRRDRSPCACSAYCARSFLALSVTETRFSG